MTVEKKPRIYVCPKCDTVIDTFIEGYVEHRLQCSNNDPKVIDGLRKIGLDPDKYLPGSTNSK